MSWEAIIDQMKEWVLDQNYLTTSFVDRGDPAAEDFNQGDFADDSAWHDLDLSSIVPEGAKAVLFAFEGRSPNAGRMFKLREKGNANDINISITTIQIAAMFITNDFVCPCNTDRFVQYWSSFALFNTVKLTVKGWWL